MARSYLITLSESDLQTLVFACVDRSIKLNLHSVEKDLHSLVFSSVDHAIKSNQVIKEAKKTKNQKLKEVLNNG